MPHLYPQSETFNHLNRTDIYDLVPKAILLTRTIFSSSSTYILVSYVDFLALCELAGYNLCLLMQKFTAGRNHFTHSYTYPPNTTDA